MTALDIIFISLGVIFVLLTIALILGAFIWQQKRKDRVKHPFSSDNPTHTVVHVDGEGLNTKSVLNENPLDNVNFTYVRVDENLADEEKKINRPNHISIPSLSQNIDVKAEKVLSYDTNIAIDEFCRRIDKYHTEDDCVFIDEFGMLNKIPVFTGPNRKSMLDSEANMKRNRFLDVLPFDENRVKIDHDDHDYINASFVDGFSEKNLFIATQGPLGDTEVSVSSGRRFSTVRDFWKMVWGQDVRCIIMLTQCVENCRPKCAQYWPSSVEDSETFDEITVDLISTTDDPISFLREFIVQKGEEKRRISQFHFKEWEDAKAPESCEHLLDFVERIKKGNHKSPILVHCSAGVGRTGVFIALYNLLTQLDQPSTTHLDVFKTVTRLREQRVRMVQTIEQYVILYDALAAAIACKFAMNEISLRDLTPTKICGEVYEEGDTI